MEQAKTPQNLLFDRIHSDLMSQKPEQIVSILKTIETEQAPLSISQFETLGSIAYMCGLDFISQTEKYNPMVLKNVKKRFDNNNINKEIFEQFISTLKVLKIENIEAPKDAIKDAVNNTLKIKDAGELLQIRTLIKNILKASNVPVQFAIDTNKLIVTKEFTYMHLLQFNSMYYEQIELNGGSFNDSIMLLSKDTFKKAMQEASKRFDDQKYAIIRFDSIFSVKEFLHAKDFNADVIFSEEFVTTLEASEKQAAEKEANESNGAQMEIVSDEEKKPAELETPAEEKPIVAMSDTDYFVKGLLEENGNIEIVDAETFMLAINSLYENEDLMQDIYKLLKAQHLTNRKDLNEVYGFDFNVAIEKIDAIVEKNRVAYNELMVKYIQEIPADISNSIINTINDVIRSLIISDKDTKGYLLQQLYENQITTYKQLHQTVGLIEKCSIKGDKLVNYVNLRNLASYNNEIMDVFQAAVNLDVYQLKLQFYYGMATFFKQVDKTVTKETADL